MLATGGPTYRAAPAPVPHAPPTPATARRDTGGVGGPAVTALLDHLLARQRWTTEAATIDAEDILTQADEAGGFDPVG